MKSYLTPIGIVIGPGLICAIGVMAAFSFFSAASGTEIPSEIPTLQYARITFFAPALAPIGHTEFCLQYPGDCTTQGSELPALTTQRLEDLASVNQEVNREILPAKATNLESAWWRVAPKFGDCNDYAVTKRHELLAHGWPSDALLLSEVVIPSGEHHLVLLVHMRDTDLVLDNLDSAVRPVGVQDYHWLRAESPADPKYWSAVSVTRISS